MRTGTQTAAWSNPQHKLLRAEVGPKLKNVIPPCYADGYKDELDSIDKDGMISIPNGPGLGVTYDWDWLNAHTTKKYVFEK